MIGESQEPVGAGVTGSQSNNKTPTLEEYGTNLTSQAEEVRFWCCQSNLDALGLSGVLARHQSSAEVKPGGPSAPQTL